MSRALLWRSHVCCEPLLTCYCAEDPSQLPAPAWFSIVTTEGRLSGGTSVQLSMSNDLLCTTTYKHERLPSRFRNTKDIFKHFPILLPYDPALWSSHFLEMFSSLPIARYTLWVKWYLYFSWFFFATLRTKVGLEKSTSSREQSLEDTQVDRPSELVK